MTKNTSIIIALFAGILLGYVFHAMVPRTEKAAVDHSMHGMNSAMDSMTGGLSGKTGDEFDRAFLSEMIIHHEGAVAMAQAALQNAKHEEIKNLAEAIISAQNKEISDMKEWLRNWYGN